MRFESHFTIEIFDTLKAGDFFFHPFSGSHSPAIKVTTLDGTSRILDLDAIQQNGKRLPSIVNKDDFIGTAVICARSATIRAQGGLENLQAGASTGSPPSGSLVFRNDGLHIKAMHKLSSLHFDVASGAQSPGIDSAQCAWTTLWEIIVRDEKGDAIVLFSRG